MPDLFYWLEIVIGGRVFIASIDAGISKSNDFEEFPCKTHNCSFAAIREAGRNSRSPHDGTMSKKENRDLKCGGENKWKIGKIQLKLLLRIA